MTQIQLSFSAMIIAIIISIPIGIWTAKNIKISQLMINSSNILRVIPSLAVLAIMIPYVGTGFTPSVIALIILASPTIIINTYAGIRSVDKDVIEAAIGMGLNNREILLRIEIPLALSIIISGLKTASIQVIASSTLAAFIGGGGLGEYIILGVGMNDLKFILIGTIPISLIAIISEYLLDKLERNFQYNRR